MESVSWFKHAKQFKHCYKHVRKGQLVGLSTKAAIKKDRKYGPHFQSLNTFI